MVRGISDADLELELWSRQSRFDASARPTVSEVVE
jgi:hypothetical protein